MTTPNPLIAERQDTTGRWTGVPIAEDIEGLISTFASGDWIDPRAGGFAGSLDALAFVVDPNRQVTAWGVAWLIEHVQPLSEALDALAGDPDQIAAFAQTWHNVATAVEATANDLGAAIDRETAEWTGVAADAYRQHIGEHVAALAALASAARGIGEIVHGAGLLIAAVRTLVRDLIAALVAELSTRLWQWLAEEAVSLGLATPGLVSRVVALVATWADRIRDLLDGLVASLGRLTPIVDRLEELITSSAALLARLDRTGTGFQDPSTVTALRAWSSERLDAWARERAESLLDLSKTYDGHLRVKERVQWWVEQGMSIRELRAIETQLWHVARTSLEEGTARSFGHFIDAIEERSGPDTTKEQFDRTMAEQWASSLTTDQLARELQTLADKAEFGQAQPEELTRLQHGADILHDRKFAETLGRLGGLSDTDLARTIEELDIRVQETGSPEDARTLSLAKDVRWGRRHDKGLDTVVINEAGRIGTIRDLATEAHRAYVRAGLNALTGNFASAATFAATGNASLAEAVGQSFDAFGGLAEGRNQWQAAHPGASGVGHDDVARAAEVFRDRGHLPADDGPYGTGETRGGAPPGPVPDSGRRFTPDEVDHIVRGIVEADTAQPGHAPPGGHGPRAISGEQGMGFHHSQEKGWAFLDGPSGSGGGHPWNAGGPDGFAYRTQGAFEMHILDNKSYQSPGNVREAPALTDTLAANVHERLVQAMDPRMNDVPRIDEVRRALADTESALRSGASLPPNVHLVVTNEGGRAGGVSTTLSEHGVEFRDIQTPPRPPGADAR